MKFKPGQLVVTRGVHAMMTGNEEFANHVILSITRHVTGDWGDVSDDDRASNELQGVRLFSVYKREGYPRFG